MSRVATVRIADLDRVFKAMKRNGLHPRAIVRPGGVEVFGDPAPPATVDTRPGVSEGAAPGEDLDAELRAWQAEHDHGEP